MNPKPKFLARTRVRTRTGEKEWPSQTKRLIDYWILYSFSTVVESTVAQDTLLALIPLWWTFKILAIVWGSISLSLGAADAAGASSGAKEKTRPRPLVSPSIPGPRSNTRILTNAIPPQKLRTNSNLIRIPSPTIAKTSQTSYGDIDSSSSSSSSPSQHSSSATAVDTSYTNPYPGISTGTGTGARTGAAAETGLTPNSPELQASRDELGLISPVLSRTPEHLRPCHEAAGPEGKEEGPATATSEDGSGVFGLSEVDRESEISDSDSDSDTDSDSNSNSDSDSETDPGSGSESDSNTNSDSDAGSDSDPNAPFSDSSPLPRPPSRSPSLATNPTNPNTSARPSHSNNPNPNPITANAANAAFTDDSNDIRLPLDTPLDELALRGLKTIELEVEEEEEDGDGDGQAEIGHWEGREGREKEKGMKIDPAPVPSSPGNPTKPPATRPQNPLGEMGEGSITRLTLDDLLALEDNGSFSPLPTGMKGMTSRSERNDKSAGNGFGSKEITLDGFEEMYGGGDGRGLVGNTDPKRKEIVPGFEPLQTQKASSAGDVQV